jgi:hypothetical protein
VDSARKTHRREIADVFSTNDPPLGTLQLPTDAV